MVESELIITYASSSKDGFTPVALKFSFQSKSHATTQWIAKFLDLSYADSLPKKRVKVLVNPKSGRGTAKTSFSKHIEPLLTSARCSIDVVETTQRGHGTAILEKLDVEAFDVVIVCSGDGLAHEVFNGLGKRQDARRALRKIAIAQLPCGSGNGLSRNLNDTASVSTATLSVIKGVRKPLDLVSITQGDRRSLSFLSQATGVAAESDIATENLRWMGEIRFHLGFFWRLLIKKVYPAEISIKVVMEDKASVLDHNEKESAVQARENQEHRFSGDVSVDSALKCNGLPPLVYGTVKDKLPEDWMVVPRDKLGNFYCGNVSLLPFS